MVRDPDRRAEEVGGAISFISYSDLRPHNRGAVQPPDHDAIAERDLSGPLLQKTSERKVQSASGPCGRCPRRSSSPGKGDKRLEEVGET